MNDLIDPEIGNNNIEINNSLNKEKTESISNADRNSNASKSSDSNSSQNNSQSTPSTNSIEDKIGQKVAEEAKNQIYKSWIDRYLCCFNWLKKYFQINTFSFFNRVWMSLVPFNQKFYDLVNDSPDFYGPFWIYTTFIVLISACGSLSRTIQGRRDKNFFQEFVPTAAILIYCIGFGVPIFITLLSKIFGAVINVAPIICIYGYSYTIFLPIIIICCIPNNLLQWLMLAYAIFSSTSLIIMSITRTMSSVQKGKKIGTIVIICIFQIVVFFVLKLYFFKNLNKELTGDLEDFATNSTLNATLNSTFEENGTSTQSYKKKY